MLYSVHCTGHIYTWDLQGVPHSGNLLVDIDFSFELKALVFR